MEKIIYRLTLDTQRTGIQKTLQGFETADNMSRRIAISLVSGSDTYEIEDNVVAMMYVTTPDATEPSINACEIEDNTIIYDALPIVEEGITTMQMKLIKTSVDGAEQVLASPRFAVEVTESEMSDDDAIQSTTFTALEDAIAKANGAYNSRLMRVEITEDYKFRAYYADDTIYETDALYEALHNGNAILSQSYAVGGTGVREGEDTDNSKYYSNVSRSASADANSVAEESRELLDEARLQTAYTAFNVNFESGNLDYASANYEFDVNEDTGELEAHSDGSYVPEQVIGGIVNDYLEDKTTEIDNLLEEKTTEIDNKIEMVIEDVTTTETNVALLDAKFAETEAIAKGATKALSYATYADMIASINEMDATALRSGQNLFIGTVGVPDLWIYSVEDTSVEYTYVDDVTFVDAMTENVTVQIGHYKISQLETQKVDLRDIPIALLRSDWVANEKGTYSQTVAIEGLGENNNPVVYLNSLAKEPTEEEYTAFALLEDEAEVNAGSITFVAEAIPDISFTILAKSVTASPNTDALAQLTRLVAKVDELEAENDTLNDNLANQSEEITALNRKLEISSTEETLIGTFGGANYYRQIIIQEITVNPDTTYDIPFDLVGKGNVSFEKCYVIVDGHYIPLGASTYVALSNGKISFKQTITSTSQKSMIFVAWINYTKAS